MNDKLELGSNYLPLLFDTLIRFRLKQVALQADIQAAFVQILIKNADKDMLRFLWYDDVGKENPSIVHLRHNRLVFGLVSSMSILGETIRKHIVQYEERYPQVCNILKRLYADDLSCVADSREEALEIYRQSKEIMLKGGFNLRKWNTNDEQLLKEINSIECKHGNESIRGSATETTGGSLERSKILGMKWDSKSDNLIHELHDIVEFAKALTPSKRSVLKLAAKIFDPLGILSLFTINIKLFFQELCTDKVSWDEELTGLNLKKFESIISELQSLEAMEIPRFVFEKGKAVRKIEIHGYSDASEKAQGCVLYLRVVYASGEVATKFLASKAKTNPVKKQSIPRLELCAAVLLSKLVNTVKSIIQEDRPTDEKVDVFYWVDSISALCWIKNNKPWNVYVRNRVAEILKVSKHSEWFYCPGLQNPADLPSRGNYGKHLASNLFWLEGPGFLKSAPEDWPKSPQGNELEIGEAIGERVKNEPTIIHAMFSSETCINKVINIERFSSKERLLRVVAYVLRFIDNLCHRNQNNITPVSASEIERAEKMVIRSIQKECFSKDIAYLELNKKEKERYRIPSYSNQFNLFIDEDDILRCRSRIINANIPDAGKTPILLPSRNHYSKLLIEHCHAKVMHNGPNETLHLVRQRYWMPRGREQVKNVVKKCYICKKLEGLPYHSKFCNELPDFRVDDGPPFKNVGIDFAGPLIVKNKGSDERKAYICLFTCASTRAVHLELVESLEVEYFLRAFRRFAARRGLPGMVITDNAKTFKAAAKEVGKLFRSPRVKEYFTCKSVEWRFIIELSPWQGGMWERMIRSTKRCLKKIIGQAMLSYSELCTLLVEVEAVINARPITYVTDDSDGIAYPLTPSQLINGRNLQVLPNENYNEVVSTYESLSRRGRYHCKLLRQFTNRWKHEYLSSLLQAYKPQGSAKESMIQVGDMVILSDGKVKRNFWKLAKIISLFKGKDGVYRAARIEVSKGGKKSILNRSVKLLIPLEVRTKPDEYSAAKSSSECADAPAQHTPAQDTPAQDIPSARPRRNAALIGELMRQGQV